HRWNMQGAMKFIGFRNYKELFTNLDFRITVSNTFFYMIMNVSLTVVLALALALFLNRDTKFANFLQTLSFTPTVTSLVSISLIWMWIFNTEAGLLNFILSIFHIPPVGWLSDKKVALFSLVLVSVWKGVGFNAILISSSLGSIPGYLYEAAKLDNASKSSIFFNITLKMISPTLFFVILMNIIASFEVFETINVMTQGGPDNATNTLVFSIYKQGFEYYRVGYASAMAVVLMIFVAIITLIYFKVVERQVHYR
ncbi:MAG: sugar ABC transporter permease, partial [Spirochaetales bacterium]|nr:sugar ABC transporter permease [Spirochaetales bacterium]